MKYFFLNMLVKDICFWMKVFIKNYSLVDRIDENNVE